MEPRDLLERSVLMLRLSAMQALKQLEKGDSEKAAKYLIHGIKEADAVSELIQRNASETDMDLWFAP